MEICELKSPALEDNIVFSLNWSFKQLMNMLVAWSSGLKTMQRSLKHNNLMFSISRMKHFDEALGSSDGYFVLRSGDVDVFSNILRSRRASL